MIGAGRVPFARVRPPRWVLGGVLAALVLGVVPVSGQIPLGSRSGRGQTVTPAYEGWYENADGTLSLSFGYMNRNFEETIEVPLGADNRIEPGELDGAQPTLFAPRRHFGVFVVRVPADFGEDDKVYWTLTTRGQTTRIPGHIHSDWKIDALKGEAGGGNTPPVLWFEEDGDQGAGPAGVWGRTQNALASVPHTIVVWAKDDGVRRGSVRSGGAEEPPVNLTWFKHQGPGEVAFSESTARVPSSGGMASTDVTFAEPGTYVLRVRANDASGVSAAGHAQCCWTNGFVTVEVQR